jgi:hypothetical protein
MPCILTRGGRRGCDRMVVGFKTTYAITIIKIKSKFYNFDHKYQYEIKIISKKNSGKKMF